MRKVVGGKKSSEGSSSSSNSNSKHTPAAPAAHTSKTEQEAILKSFEILICDFPQYVLGHFNFSFLNVLFFRVLSQIVTSVDSSDHNQLCSVLINLSLTCGCTFGMLRIFMESEFIKNARGDPGAIMRGNCIASKLAKEYLSRKCVTTFLLIRVKIKWDKTT